MTSPVTFTTEGPLGLITIANPPVNALGHAVRTGLMDAMAKAGADDAVQAVVIMGDGATFPAGADIREFGGEIALPALPTVCDAIEACDKPVVAAIHGTTLGGGLEVALGAHYRVADSKTKVGLPEVLLGILPGAGGTQRLPRITGAALALEMMTSGAPIKADKALKAGIIDEIADGDVNAAAKAFALQLIADDKGPRRTSERTEGLADKAANDAAIAATKEILAKKARGLLSPFRIVECVEEALSGSSFTDGMAVERAKIAECFATDQCKGLVHAFFAERTSAKIPEAARAKPRQLAKLAVIGGGTMGSGITVSALDAGLQVTMLERDADSIARGQANVEKVYDRLIAKGRITAEQKAAIMANYTPTTDYAAIADVDMVIEAVFEEMPIKKAVFAELDKHVRQGAVLASNTSYLDIDELADSISRPADVIGLHFFSPANIMKLLEIVVPAKASDDAVATGFALAKKMRKVPVRAGVCDGFIGNRILGNYAECAGHIMIDGASPYQIDRAVRDFGYPMGPYQMFDLAGLDIGWATRKRKAATRNPDARYIEVNDKICENGWFGQKTGRGFYIYENGSRTGTEDPEILAMISDEQKAKGITPRAFSDEEIMQRYMAAMVNEAAKVLEEGIALRPSDIDVTFMYGYGFPRYRGGPMKYADMYGLDRMLADIRTYEREDALFWKPAQLLIDLVERGETFESLNKKAG